MFLGFSRFTGSIPSAWFAPGGMEALQVGGLPVVWSLWMAAVSCAVQLLGLAAGAVLLLGFVPGRAFLHTSPCM